MTPLKIGLVLIIIILFCLIMKESKSEAIKIVGGFAILLFFLDLIWAVFYYL